MIGDGWLPVAHVLSFWSSAAAIAYVAISGLGRRWMAPSIVAAGAAALVAAWGAWTGAPLALLTAPAGPIIMATLTRERLAAWLGATLVAAAASLLGWLTLAVLLQWTPVLALVGGGVTGGAAGAAWVVMDEARRRAALAQSLRAGVVLDGRYRIGRRIGSGAHGQVRLARDRRERRLVVVKQWYGLPGGEAKLLRSVRHPNVVSILDEVVSVGGACLIMSYAAGGSLHQRRADGATWHAWATDALSGLAAIHDAGIVHRDIKPANLLLTKNGRVQVADFGLATKASDEVTRLGDPAVGTVAYMSPEQARGHRVGVAGDLYSMAAVLYEVLTGERVTPAHPGDTLTDQQLRVASGPAPDWALVPLALRPWFEQALAADPKARHSSARAMRDAVPDEFG